MTELCECCGQLLLSNHARRPVAALNVARLVEALTVARAAFLAVWLRKPKPSPDFDFVNDEEWHVIWDLAAEGITIDEAIDVHFPLRGALAEALFGWLPDPRA